jgi:hypothetical protein
MHMTRFLLSLAVWSVVGCGGRVDRQEASGTAKSKSSSESMDTSWKSAAATAAVPTATAMATTPSAPAIGAKVFTLKSNDRVVKVSFSPPPGWQKDPLGERESFVVFQGSWQAIFSVSLTCQGTCDKDPAVLKKNIEKQFAEDFRATSKGTPVLKGEWLMKPKEDPPGIVTASFLAKDGDTVKEQAYIRDQLLPGVPFFVECRIKLDDHEPSSAFDKLQQACKDLKAEFRAN